MLDDDMGHFARRRQRRQELRDRFEPAGGGADRHNGVNHGEVPAHAPTLSMEKAQIRLLNNLPIVRARMPSGAAARNNHQDLLFLLLVSVIANAPSSGAASC
jgi:hypothetical protein